MRWSGVDILTGGRWLGRLFREETMKADEGIKRLRAESCAPSGAALGRSVDGENTSK